MCFSFMKKRQKGRINDQAEKRLAPCRGRKRGPNLIWLDGDLSLSLSLSVSLACSLSPSLPLSLSVCPAEMHSVRGLWESDRMAVHLNGASGARSSGESPQTRCSRPATQRGIRPEEGCPD